MKLLDVRWSLPVNKLIVLCDCGLLMEHPSNYSVVRCCHCNRQELWHAIEPKPQTGPWSLPVMTLNLGDIDRPSVN